MPSFFTAGISLRGLPYHTSRLAADIGFANRYPSLISPNGSSFDECIWPVLSGITRVIKCHCKGATPGKLRRLPRPFPSSGQNGQGICAGGPHRSDWPLSAVTRQTVVVPLRRVMMPRGMPAQPPPAAHGQIHPRSQDRVTPQPARQGRHHAGALPIGGSGSRFPLHHGQGDASAFGEGA